MIDYIEKAKAFAMMAHKGQTDKAGEDYFTAYVAVVADGVEPDPLVKAAAYLHDTVEDIIIHFDGTPKEFAKEFEMHVLVAMTSNFEHAFLDFSDINSISRSHFELAVAQFMSAYEREEGKVDNFCNDDKD